MNRVVKFFHEMFHPHCIDCMREEDLALTCDSCESLKEQLRESNRREKDLLVLLIEKNKPQPVPEPAPISIPEPVRPQYIPWHIRKRELEAQDRKQAEILRQQAQLEKEMNLETVSEDGNATGTEKRST